MNINENEQCRLEDIVTGNRAICFYRYCPDNGFPSIRWSAYGDPETSEVIVRANKGTLAYLPISQEGRRGKGSRGAIGSYRNEGVLIGSFLETAAEKGAQLVGYNSAGADLPILVQRAMANGCVCPKFGHRPEKPWEGQDYWSRFSDANLDLMQALSLSTGRGAATPSLHEFANACGFPGKLGTSGDNVAQLWLNGKHDEIIAYNETDACTTYLLWLRYARFRGLLDETGSRQERDKFRSYFSVF